jgi:nitrite reductase/ring-hydroxylating ferredoxin subunit
MKFPWKNGVFAAEGFAKKSLLLGRALPPAEPWSTAPDWVQANESHIEKTLARALARPSGGWLVVAPSRAVDTVPRSHVLAGREYIAWRDGDGAHVAPTACPHMGASLACADVKNGAVVCPWHGLRLGPRGHGDWKHAPSFDDGVLLWARLEEADAPTERPILAPRPAKFLDAVISMEASCDPSDIVANRLDPWHGVHYHPHSFSELTVLSVTPDVITLRVTYRIAGPVGMAVDATFHSPEPNSIVMTIVAGEGVGSVVETHATPVAPGRVRVIEATLATSDRPGFSGAVRAARLLRPLVETRARRLWVEDCAYAERRYALRQGDAPRGGPEQTTPLLRIRSGRPTKPRVERGAS